MSEDKLRASLMLAEVKGWATLAANRLDPSHPGLDRQSEDKAIVILSMLQAVCNRARELEQSLLSASSEPIKQPEKCGHQAHDWPIQSP